MDSNKKGKIYPDHDARKKHIKTMGLKKIHNNNLEDSMESCFYECSSCSREFTGPITERHMLLNCPSCGEDVILEASTVIRRDLQPYLQMSDSKLSDLMKQGKIDMKDFLDIRDFHKEQGNWIPGTGEHPFLYKGTRLVYVWQPTTGKKGYLNLDHDIVYNDMDCTEVVD